MQMSLTFGHPDPNILRSPVGTDFHQFKFKSIGKEPELLKRLSTISYEEGAHYQYSPSPEPDARYQYSPEPEPHTLPAHTEARTRPSLLQALTNSSESHDSPFSTSFESYQHPQQLPSPAVDDMQLQYPETPIQEPSFTKPNSPPPPPPPPPFVPDYAALKALHTRLETAHTVLAAPPPPKKPLTPPPDFPRPSLIAANNAVHHSEKSHTYAKEALQASQARTAVAEQGVSVAQTVVDTLTQALAAARTALEVAQKTLLEARQAAEEAQAALLSSRAAADAAEETKRLLEEPPPPRTPTSEPTNDNAELIEEMKKDLASLRLWAEEQEAGHLPASAAAHRDISQGREKEEEREASKMILDDNDTDGEARDTNDVSAQLPPDEHPAPEGKGQADMQVDEPRRLEEDAARALVELAEQKITTQSPRAPTEQGKTGLAIADIPAERLPVEELSVSEAALAREAALRKQQEARREQVKIQKQHAHAAAALSILKERQDAAEKSKSAAQTTPPLSNVDTHPAGNVVARNTVLPPTQAKLKTKKSKPVSGGVKLGPDVVAKAEPSVPVDTSADVLASTNPSSIDPSPALERAAALGLRVRTNAAKSADTSTTSSKPKKTRNCSLPPISHLDPGSPQTDDISAHRTGSDAGDIPIMPTALSMPFDVSADIQLMNLRFALQDDGIIPWEAISRSRPLMPGVKKEEIKKEEVKKEEIKKEEIKKEVVEDNLQARILAPQYTPAPTPAQRPQPVINPPIATPTRSAPATPVVTAKPPKKQLPKFNKSKPQSGNTNSNIQASTSAAVDISVPLKPRPKDAPTVPVLPVQASPVTDPRKWSPPVPVAAPVATSVAAPSAPQRTGTNPIPTKARALPQVRPESRSSNPGSGVSTPVHESNGYASRPLNERVSATQWRERSPVRFRSPTPDRDRYGGRAFNAYGGEPQRYRSPEPVGRPRSPPLTWPVQSTPLDYHDKWLPRSPARSPSPQRFRPPPRRASPPPQKRVDSPARRNFSAPSAPAYYPRQNSPPKGPRQNIPRAPSQNQKRPRDDEYTTPFHPQKRFKDDGRDASAAASRSLELETDRPSLETRLARAPPDSWNAHQHSARGESYHPVSPDYDDWPPRSEGLLSRLSEPGPGRGNPRGRGGPRGRANKSRGRGRGEVSLVERMY